MPRLKIWTGAWLIGIAVASLPAFAHEFWIDPQPFTPQQGGEVSLGLKVGKMMKGVDYPYLSNAFETFTITTRERSTDVEGIEGDIPAATYQAEAAGLHIIAYQSLPLPITFETFAEFVGYLSYEGLAAVSATHRARGLPETGISERYIRCAKALVQSGPVELQDADRPVGLTLELVAEANPYGGSGLSALPVRLIWKGGPVAGRQVSIFRYDGAVTRSLVTTDADGRVLVPLAGGGQFLLNAVQMDPVEHGAVMWESHWASLTFGLPLR